MQQKITTSPGFSRMEAFMKSLPALFEKEGKVLKKGRNEIRIIEYNRLQLCIKSFNKVTAVNRLLYSWFRKTKAERSYLTARKLESLGIHTPAPIGFVEIYSRGHILQRNYYVSLFQPHPFDMSNVIEQGEKEWEEILKAFVCYMATKVHPAGVWHNDLSQGNILILKNHHNHPGNSHPVKYRFSIIDLNRIKFKVSIPPILGLSNLKKLTTDPVLLAKMGQFYAQASHKPESRYAFFLLRSSYIFHTVRRITKRVLHAFKFSKKKQGGPR